MAERRRSEVSPSAVGPFALATTPALRRSSSVGLASPVGAVASLPRAKGARDRTSLTPRPSPAASSPASSPSRPSSSKTRSVELEPLGGKPRELPTQQLQPVQAPSAPAAEDEAPSMRKRRGPACGGRPVASVSLAASRRASPQDQSTPTAQKRVSVGADSAPKAKRPRRSTTEMSSHSVLKQHEDDEDWPEASGTCESCGRLTHGLEVHGEDCLVLCDGCQKAKSPGMWKLVTQCLQFHDAVEKTLAQRYEMPCV